MADKIKKTIEETNPEEEKLFVSLRAGKWGEFCGQERIKKIIVLFIASLLIIFISLAAVKYFFNQVNLEKKIQKTGYQRSDFIDLKNIKDEDSELLYIEKGNVFLYSMKNQQARKLIDRKEEITSANFTTKGNIIFTTRIDNVNLSYHLYDSNKSLTNAIKNIDFSVYAQCQQIFEKGETECYFSKNINDNGLGIYRWQVEEKNPVKIGEFEAEKRETGCMAEVCEENGKLITYYFPEADNLLPSLGGEYLLNSQMNGGGMGKEAFVISRDGKRIYKINNDFYWYTTSAVWISNNQLLVYMQQQQKPNKILTFKSDGTYEAKIIPDLDCGLGGLTQKNLSGSRKYLSCEGVIYNIENRKQRRIDEYTDNGLVKKYNLDYGTIERKTIGWSKNNRFLLYKIRFEGGKETKPSHEFIDEMRVFDIQGGKSYLVAAGILASQRSLFYYGSFDIR